MVEFVPFERACPPTISIFLFGRDMEHIFRTFKVSRNFGPHHATVQRVELRSNRSIFRVRYQSPDTLVRRYRGRYWFSDIGEDAGFQRQYPGRPEHASAIVRWPDRLSA